MSSSVRLFFMHGRSSTDFSTSGEVTKESMDRVKKFETEGSQNGKTKSEVNVTASGVVEE
jgi:hypothetical protein